MVLTKFSWGIFEIFSFGYVTFFRKYQIHYCNLWGNKKKTQLYGKFGVVEQNLANFGTQGQ